MRLPKQWENRFFGRKNEVAPINEFQNEFNKLFNSFFSELDPGYGWKRAGSWTPAMNLSETEKEYKITAELPGLEEGDIDLRVQNNTLYIKGEKKFEHEEDKEDYHHVETSYGQFQRSMHFPSEIDVEKVSAKFKNGILTVSVSKADHAIQQSRKIQIK